MKAKSFGKKNNTVHTKKAQITVVLIVVMLLVTIFSIMFYIQRSTQETRQQERQQAVQLSQEKIDPLHEFVTSCLDISAKAALIEIGKQGGYLFESQGGPIPDFSELEFAKKYFEYDKKKVAYAIHPPKGDVGRWSSTPPEYPWVTFPEVHNITRANRSNGSLMNQSIVTGYFGRNILPNLKNPFTNSMQFQIEQFIQTNAAKCLNLDKFQTQSLAIRKGVPVVNVTFTQTQTIFDLFYPLDIIENKTGAQGHLEQFAVKYDVRLQKIIEFMEQTSDKDVTDMNFNMSNVTSGALTAWVEKDVHADDDAIFIRDRDSKILGDPYTFLYARKNRGPALGWINSTSNKERYEVHKFVLCGVFAGGKLKGPVIKIANNNLVLENQHSSCRYKTTSIPLQGFDPDEDDLKFVIEVNREEFTEYELQEREVGVLFTFIVKVKDESSQDSEQLVMGTEVVTPK